MTNNYSESILKTEFQNCCKYMKKRWKKSIFFEENCLERGNIQIDTSKFYEVETRQYPGTEITL